MHDYFTIMQLFVYEVVKNKASMVWAWEMGVPGKQTSWFNKMDAGCNYVIEEKLSILI